MVGVGGGEGWGKNCITAVQNRSERFFMGVGQYTPSAAVNGGMEWEKKPFAKQWLAVVNKWIRIKNMHSGRINKK